MRSSLGETRSRIKRSHALVCADSHEIIGLPHWPDTDVVSYVTPGLGAGFSLFRIVARRDTLVAPPPHGGIRFVLIRSGEVRVTDGTETRLLRPDDYAYLPSSAPFTLGLSADAEILCLEHAYKPLSGCEPPGAFFGAIPAVDPVPLKGNEQLHVQKLLPEAPGFDMEVNVMTFAPGGSLPYVETHFMEHGLVMLDGGGIYRLDDSWYPVAQGDVIWMAPFCPQWFGALGREDARYLIYKNWNRDPLA
ncbi:(S)-ureidoglycine aminohydrolase [Martelella mediterranea]|uniref:Putative allantoin catabolism protein n=1 Tax=Martelella mediterranea DSM 17316 TaxID=1122214 RepID=A0A1U9YWH6_9HYPH|nr:(S)-ureidoglycine aminohydrolase [Martelella mediterranea]AQZ49795.1 putative allantoin catabolism protein [Martelella mediterranea DSM 17316]